MSDDPVPTDRRGSQRPRSGPPSWLILSVLSALLLTGFAIAIAWYEIVDERGENRDECLQTVQFRHDNRLMWLELFQAFPEQAEETGLSVDLDQLLPPLRCDGSSPVPLLPG